MAQKLKIKCPRCTKIYDVSNLEPGQVILCLECDITIVVPDKTTSRKVPLEKLKAALQRKEQEEQSLEVLDLDFSQSGHSPRRLVPLRETDAPAAWTGEEGEQPPPPAGVEPSEATNPRSQEPGEGALGEGTEDQDATMDGNGHVKVEVQRLGKQKLGRFRPPDETDKTKGETTRKTLPARRDILDKIRDHRTWTFRISTVLVLAALAGLLLFKLAGSSGEKSRRLEARMKCTSCKNVFPGTGELGGSSNVPTAPCTRCRKDAFGLITLKCLECAHEFDVLQDVIRREYTCPKCKKPKGNMKRIR